MLPGEIFPGQLLLFMTTEKKTIMYLKFIFLSSLILLLNFMSSVTGYAQTDDDEFSYVEASNFTLIGKIWIVV